MENDWDSNPRLAEGELLHQIVRPDPPQIAHEMELVERLSCVLPRPVDLLSGSVECERSPGCAGTHLIWKIAWVLEKKLQWSWRCHAMQLTYETL